MCHPGTSSNPLRKDPFWLEVGFYLISPQPIQAYDGNMKKRPSESHAAFLGTLDAFNGACQTSGDPVGMSPRHNGIQQAVPHIANSTPFFGSIGQPKQPDMKGK